MNLTNSFSTCHSIQVFIFRRPIRTSARSIREASARSCAAGAMRTGSAGSGRTCCTNRDTKGVETAVAGALAGQVVRVILVTASCGRSSVATERAGMAVSGSAGMMAS